MIIYTIHISWSAFHTRLIYFHVILYSHSFIYPWFAFTCIFTPFLIMYYSHNPIMKWKHCFHKGRASLRLYLQGLTSTRPIKCSVAALKRLAASHWMIASVPDYLVLMDDSWVYFWVEACGLKCIVLIKKKEFKNISYDLSIIKRSCGVDSWILVY